MSDGKMHLQDSSEDVTSPHLFSFMENRSGLPRERVQVCRHRTHDSHTHMHTHVHTRTRKKKNSKSCAHWHRIFVSALNRNCVALTSQKQEHILVLLTSSPTTSKADVQTACRVRIPGYLSQQTAVEIAYSDLSREVSDTSKSFAFIYHLPQAFHTRTLIWPV